MAIQMRRGLLVDYDKDKMLAGEWGIAIDNDPDFQKAYIAFGPGVDKEVMFVDDAESQIAVAAANAVDTATAEAEAWAHGSSFTKQDYASGDGSTTVFALTETPSSITAVYVDGTATTAYTRSGATITFTTAPSSGSNNVHVVYTVSTSTNNAMYYKNQAASSATSASGSASSASSSASTATNKASAASSSASAAATSEDNAEAWARGTINGVNVSSSADQYHNNSMYYAGQAATSAQNAASSATNASTSEGNASGSATTANNRANAASASATAAADSQNNAEAWAVGQINGSDVGSDDARYHNNSKYYAEQAAASAASLTVDSAMSDSSTNPVQNKVINTELTSLNNQLNAMHLYDRDDSDAEYTITNEVIAGHLVTTYTKVSA